MPDGEAAVAAAVEAADSAYVSGYHHATASADTFESTSGDTPLTPSMSVFGSPHELQPEGDLRPVPRKGSPAGMWMLYVLIVCLGSLAVARYFFPGRFKRLLQSVFGLRFFLQLDKEGIIMNETPSYLLKVNFLLSLSLLMVQTVHYYSLATPWGMLHGALLFGGALVFLILFYILKRLLLIYLSWLFGTPHVSQSYFNNIFVFNHFAGIMILPIVFYQAFNPLSGALHLAWGLLILINIYKVIRGAYLGHSLAGFSLYYLFLYLCGVELAPLLILGKSVTKYMF